MKFLIIRYAALFAVAVLAAPASAATVNWNGGGPGDSWATAANWAGNSLPGLNDTLLFDNTGGSVIAGEVTNLLNSSRTVGGLTFLNDGRFHTTYLGGFTLNVAGNLDFNPDEDGPTTTVLRNGILDVTGGSAFGELTLAAANVIDTAEVTVGNNGTRRLRLGADNTILTDQFTIDYGS